MATITSPEPRGQAARPLWERLKSVFPDVECERRFPWLVQPKADEAMDLEAEVKAALIEHCRETQFKHRGEAKQECSPELLASKLGNPARPQLEFDFFIPHLNLAIEFDERQHFSVERAVSLKCYEGKVLVLFSIGDWIGHCERIRAVDSDPIWRDWQRAYRDASRDLRAAAHGINIMRYKYGELPTEDGLQELATKCKDVTE